MKPNPKATIRLSNEAIYPDGWEVMGTIFVRVTAFDESFSWSYGSQNGTNIQFDFEFEVERFEPENIARDLRGQTGPALDSRSRKRRRHYRRQLSRRLARMVNNRVVLNEWLNENERTAFDAYQKESKHEKEKMLPCADA